MLPCLALNVQEGHSVLDLCAAPGGKTLALLQTYSIGKKTCPWITLFLTFILKPTRALFHFCIFSKGFLCVNDSSVSRTSRLRKVLRSYVPKQHLTDEKIRVSSLDGTKWGEIERNTFDRVNYYCFPPEIVKHFSEDHLTSSTSSVSRSWLTSPAPLTDTQCWRMTTTSSVKSGLVRDEDCHSSSSSCCSKI